jgi:hypothetical protein
MLYTWTQAGHVLPLGGRAAVMFNSPGYAFRYSAADVAPLRRMVALTRNGFSPTSAAALATAPDGVLRVGGYTLTLTETDQETPA